MVDIGEYMGIIESYFMEQGELSRISGLVH